MRYTICLAVLALASTAAAQNNQFSVSGVAGYQFALLKSTDYLGNEADGHTHTPIIRVGLTFHI